MSCDLSQAQSLLSVPEEFVLAARSFPEKVEQALSLLETVEDVQEILNQTDTLEHYAKRVKVDTETINLLQYGKLKIIAKLGELMPRTKGGRGKKNSHSACEGLFHPNTVTDYRKVGDHKDKIQEYFEDAKEDGEAEMSMSGFIRYVASDGNLKAHQNKGVVEWYTPSEYIEAARRVMGSIDVDPASNAKAQEVVQAGVYYTAKTNGLEKEWSGTVFMNPPFKASLIKPFVSKLVESFQSDVTTQAILLTNNSTDTHWWHEAAGVSSAICFTRGRIAFYSPAGEAASPTNGHTIFYMGDNVQLFQEHFSSFGAILSEVSSDG